MNDLYPLDKIFGPLCVRISDNILTTFNNKTTDTNFTITFSYVASLPFCHYNSTHICGPLIKIIEEVSIKYGYGYDMT